MREIRFRAWDGEQMSTFTLEIDTAGYLTTPPVPPKHFDSTKEGFKEIMQYTGLKDKNGKEIYEGDVVKWRSHPNKTVEASEVRWSSHLKWILVWFADDFEREKNYPSAKDLGGHINSIEVIGNIYENPELLKHDSKV